MAQVQLTKVPGRPTIFLYNNSDVVSNNVIALGMWEELLVNELLWAMRQPVSVREAREARARCGARESAVAARTATGRLWRSG